MNMRKCWPKNSVIAMHPATESIESLFSFAVCFTFPLRELLPHSKFWCRNRPGDEMKDRHTSGGLPVEEMADTGVYSSTLPLDKNGVLSKLRLPSTHFVVVVFVFCVYSSAVGVQIVSY